jgi:hypothetical protein
MEFKVRHLTLVDLAVDQATAFGQLNAPDFMELFLVPTSMHIRSTGRSCSNIVPSGKSQYWYSDVGELNRQPGMQTLTEPIDDAAVMNSLPLSHYHKIGFCNSLSRIRNIPASVPITVSLSTVVTMGPSTELEPLKLPSCPVQRSIYSAGNRGRAERRINGKQLDSVSTLHFAWPAFPFIQ